MVIDSLQPTRSFEDELLLRAIVTVVSFFFNLSGHWHDIKGVDERKGGLEARYSRLEVILMYHSGKRSEDLVNR
jgi:hypothetical protein